MLVHEDSPGTRAVAAFDAVINNSDRKGSHLVREGGALRGFDHGVSLHEEDKLRTVFWGFAGQPLAAAELARIATVHDAAVDGDSALRGRLDELLSPAEVAALVQRCRALLDRRGIPEALRRLAGHPVAAAVRRAPVGFVRDLLARPVHPRGAGDRPPAPAVRHEHRAPCAR